MKKLNQFVSKKDQDAISNFSKMIRYNLGSKLVEIRLFGSKVKSMDSSYSDIDILIIAKEVTEELKDLIFETAVDVNLTYDVVISPLIYTTKEYHNIFIQDTYFYKATQNEGVLI